MLYNKRLLKYNKPGPIKDIKKLKTLNLPFNKAIKELYKANKRKIKAITVNQ
jgi:hypothetical protein